MERRFLLAGLTALAAAPALPAAAPVDDVAAGCEGAVAALRGWIDALASRRFDYLDAHLASDFLFTTVPMRTPGGQLIRLSRNKEEFIAQDRHLANSRIELLSVTARRLGGLVITVVYARIAEEFRGDLGAALPSAAEMNAFARNRTLGYASGWREIDGRWQCTSHHVLGEA
jgi:hypothetical protein